MISPATAYFLDGSLNNAIMHRIHATGRPSRMRAPTRNPSGEPQPNPGNPKMAHKIKTHGDKDNQNPILPSCIFFMCFP